METIREKVAYLRYVRCGTEDGRRTPQVLFEKILAQWTKFP